MAVFVMVPFSSKENTDFNYNKIIGYSTENLEAMVLGIKNDVFLLRNIGIYFDV